MVRIGKYTVRQAEVSDLDEVLAIERIAFMGMEALTIDHFHSWIKYFKDGFMVACNGKGKIIAYSMVIFLQRNDISNNWHKDTGSGTGRTHNPNGDILYGLSLASMHPGAGAALLLAERYLMDRAIGVNEAWLYIRLPNFKTWREKNCISEDIEYCLNKYIYLHIDQTQVFYEACGASAVYGVPDYCQDDVDSLYTASLMKFIKVPK